MIAEITDPVANAIVTWLSLNQGGRLSGPPSGKVYAATSVFVLGGDAEVQPGWPNGAQQLSILLDEIGRLSHKSQKYKVDFLVRELALPFIHPGAELLIMEGPKIVANAQITEVTGEVHDQGLFCAGRATWMDLGRERGAGSTGFSGNAQ